MSEVAGERPVSNPVQEVGAELRQAREQQALSVEEVALRTRIPPFADGLIDLSTS